jgi:SAM-dependent MidA family methyltransferase
MTPGPRPEAPGGSASRDPRPAPESSVEDSPSGSAELAALIRAEIESSPNGRITFARFMERALYEPGLGYYSRPEDRPTDAGDFLTAPETHRIFGWTVARRIERMWIELGRPRPFEIIEYGAGAGTLALSILEGLRRGGAAEPGAAEPGAAEPGAADLLQAIRYQPVEINPHRLDDLGRKFERAGLSGLLAGSGSPANDSAGSPGDDGHAPVTGVILANEFLDALPVHRLVVRGGEPTELFVAWHEDRRFVEVAGEPSTPELGARLAEDGIVPGQLAEGQVIEVCLGLAPWLADVRRRLERGFVIVIDYGYEAAELYGPRHFAGTLLGYRGHRVVDDPFSRVGLTDLTAHVDFTALAVLGERHGLRSVALTTQSEFLISAGLESELQALQASPATTAEDYLRARSGIVRMLDPRHMGRFRVMILALDRSAD